MPGIKNPTTVKNLFTVLAQLPNSHALCWGFLWARLFWLFWSLFWFFLHFFICFLFLLDRRFLFRFCLFHFGLLCFSWCWFSCWVNWAVVARNMIFIEKDPFRCTNSLHAAPLECSRPTSTLKRVKLTSCWQRNYVIISVKAVTRDDVTCSSNVGETLRVVSVPSARVSLRKDRTLRLSARRGRLIDRLVDLFGLWLARFSSLWGCLRFLVLGISIRVRLRVVKVKVEIWKSKKSKSLFITLKPPPLTHP